MSKRSLKQSITTPQSHHIKRPMNPFMIWAKCMRPVVAKKCVSDKVDNAEISRMLGRMWKALSLDEKERYAVEAEKEKEDHKKAFPDYKYRPRPPKKNRKPENTKAAEIRSTVTSTSSRTATKARSRSLSLPRLKSIAMLPFNSDKDLLSPITLSMLSYTSSPKFNEGTMNDLQIFLQTYSFDSQADHDLPISTSSVPHSPLTKAAPALTIDNTFFNEALSIVDADLDIADMWSQVIGDCNILNTLDVLPNRQPTTAKLIFTTNNTLLTKGNATPISLCSSALFNATSGLEDHVVPFSHWEDHDAIMMISTPTSVNILNGRVFFP